MFAYRVDPPSSWVAALEAVSPRQDRLSHLELWWEAGLPWAPVQRWVIYQLQPLAAMGDEAAADWSLLLDLERPCQCAFEWSEPPYGYRPGQAIAREVARCRHCQRMRTPSRTAIMDALLRGYQAAPFWVIQGGQGGHKLNYSTEEAQVATSLGMHATPPAPGSLPYAPFDLRVVWNLRAYDLSLAAHRSMRGARKEQREGLAKQARIAQERYLTGLMAEAKDEFADRLWDELPTAQHGTRGVDETEASARYIDTGRLT